MLIGAGEAPALMGELTHGKAHSSELYTRDIPGVTASNRIEAVTVSPSEEGTPRVGDIGEEAGG
jgi:hypothetical protein